MLLTIRELLEDVMDVVNRDNIILVRVMELIFRKDQVELSMGEDKDKVRIVGYHEVLLPTSWLLTDMLYQVKVYQVVPWHLCSGEAAPETNLYFQFQLDWNGNRCTKLYFYLVSVFKYIMHSRTFFT